MEYQPAFSQLNLVARDMAATVAFYRRLGLTVTVDEAAQHASARTDGGVRIEWDATGFVPQWDSGWAGGVGGSTVLGFALPAREAVDEVYADLTGAGYRRHQQPYDAFFGARYAIVDDPDGNPVGLMSPIDQERKYWPPSQPPAAA